MNNIVCKFGGTSLASAPNIKRVRDIINSNPNRKLVVVSAPGKRNSADIKITDSLLEIHKQNKKGEDWSELFEKVESRFLELEQELEVDVGLKSQFAKFKEEIKNGCSSDFTASRGEFFNAQIIAKFMGFKFMDAQDLLIFNKRSLNLPATETCYGKHVGENFTPIVIPGFYGANAEGEIITFERGGSDITGAVIAYCAKAKVYENWTDVNGFLCADPNIVKDPRRINQLTYRELRELSYMGASVLHTECAFYASKRNIPIHIKNTFEPENAGTLITAETKKQSSVLTGIAGKKGFSLIYIEKYNLNEMVGVFEIVSNIFREHKVSIEHMPTSIDGISAIFKTVSQPVLEDVVQSINKDFIPDRVVIRHDVALISLVAACASPLEQLKRIFDALHRESIEIVSISKDVNSLSINIGVAESDYRKTISCLYNAFETVG